MWNSAWINGLYRCQGPFSSSQLKKPNSAINPFQANVPFSDVFWGYRKGALAWNGLKPYFFEQFKPV